MAESSSANEKKLLSELDTLKSTQKEDEKKPLRKFDKCPIYVCENHNEVLEPIYKCLTSRHLPFSKNLMIHFDSHPDLCRPDHMPACFVYDKHLLFEAVNIESWILPAVYGGHIDQVAWIKPSWAKQIPTGKFHVNVGEWNKEIYVHSTLDYFISEGAFCPENNLKNKKSFELHSIEFENVLKQIEPIIDRTHDPYILDIDLDFFSTKNPFKYIYELANAYEKLKDIYITPKTYSLHNEVSIIQYSEQRREHIKYLENVFKQLDKGQAFETLEQHPSDASLLQKVEQLVREIKKFYPDQEIDYELLHNAGCTCDFIDLPHHESSRVEICEMIKAFKEFLRKLKSVPTIVTISRSSYDDYCPENVVDFIQDSVIHALTDVFQSQIMNEPKLLYLE